ncbi:MAG: PP2C family protein-serine/threonine phosphatase [Salinispira sp.]
MDITTFIEIIKINLQSPETIAILRRMFLYIIVLVYSESILKNSDFQFTGEIRAIPRILLFRELIWLFNFTPSLYISFGAVMLALFAWWYRHYASNKISLTIFTVATIIIGIGLNIAFEVLAFEIFFIIADAHMVFSIVVLSLFVFNFNAYNSKAADFIIKKRSFVPFLITTSVYALLMLNLVIGNEILSFDVLVSIMPLGIYIPLISSYNKFSHERASAHKKIADEFNNSVFEFLQTISSAVTSKVTQQEVLDYAVRTTVKLTDADAGVILVKDKNDDLRLISREGFFPPLVELPESIRARQAALEAFFENTPLKISDSVLDEVITHNSVVYIRNTEDDDRMAINNKQGVQFINSFIAVPIVIGEEVFGALVLIQRSSDKTFSDEISNYTQILASYTSVTLNSLYSHNQVLEKRELERDIDIASEIQQALLPTNLSPVLKEQIGIWNNPSKRVSGDYFDIIPLDDAGKFAVIICDVAGKGIPAALVMVMIRTITHLVAIGMHNTSRVMRVINQGISERISVERFATMSYFIYNPDNRQIEYSNAAHHPMVIYNNEAGTIEEFDSEGLPIGLESTSSYPSVKRQFGPGDTLMLYTDGIIEALNQSGVQYEEKRLKKVFKENCHLSAPDVADAIKQDVLNFVGNAEQHDDQTLIIMKIF